MVKEGVKVNTKNTIIFNGRVRTFASILRALSFLPLYFHLLVDKESTDLFLGWYNLYSFIAYFEVYISLLVVLITIPLQAYLISTVPILFVVIYSLIEFFIIEKNSTLIIINHVVAVIITFLVVKSWQMLSASRILESKVSRDILNKLTENERKAENSIQDSADNSKRSIVS